MNPPNQPIQSLSKEVLINHVTQLRICLFSARDKNKDFILFMHENPKVEKEFKKWLSNKKVIQSGSETNKSESIL